MSVDIQQNAEGVQNHLPTAGERNHENATSNVTAATTSNVKSTSPRKSKQKQHLTTTSSIFDDSHVEKTLVNGKKGWKCGFCTMHFSGEPNASKCLAHLTRTPGKHIKICCATTIPADKVAHYRTLALQLENRRRSKAGLHPITTLEELPHKPVEGNKPIGPRTWEDSMELLREYKKVCRNNHLYRSYGMVRASIDT
jgi:hypothetical protein